MARRGARALYEKAAKERMKKGGGDKKSGVENLPHPIPDQGKARDQAGKAFGDTWGGGNLPILPSAD